MNCPFREQARSHRENAINCGSEPAREEAGTATTKLQPFTRLRTATISGTSTLLMYTRNGSVMLIRSSMF